MSRIWRLLSVLLLLCAIPIGAQDAAEAAAEPAAEPAADGGSPAAGAPSSGAPVFGASVGLGTKLIDGEAYQSVSFIPDLALGPFGIGLDIQLNYQLYRWPGDQMSVYVRAADWIIDADGDARPDPWNDDSLQTYLDMYLSKIVYVRYGTKGSPLYIKLGLFEDGRIGNGFIMNGYANSLLRPEYSYSGLAFDLDGSLFGLPFFGVETFTNSVSSFDIAGGRFYVRPLAPLSVPVLGKLQIGTSAVLDSDPYIFFRRLDRTDLIEDPTAKAEAIAARDAETARYGETDVLVWGIDARQPVVNLGGAFSLDIFGDYVIQGSSSGSMVGMGGNLAFLSYGAQVRFLGENFQPVYFDRSYDLSRVQKLKTYLLNTDKFKDDAGLVSSPAMNGWFASLGASLLGGKIALFSSLEGPMGNLEGPAGDSAAAWPKLRSSLTIDGRQMLPVPVTFTGFYDKDFLKKPADVVSPENALVGAKLGYQLGAASIQLTYNLKYVPEDRRLPGQDSWEVSSKLETVISLK